MTAINLRLARVEMGLTQAQLAKELKISQESVSVYERNFRPVPDFVAEKVNELLVAYREKN